MPQSLRSKVDELADLIFGVIQAAEIAKPIGRQPAKWTPAVVEFPKSIDRAIDGVGLLDGFGRPIGGVELPVWLDGLRAALLQLKEAYLANGHKLFGERAGVLHPLLKAVSRYSSDLRRLHASQDTDAVKPKATRKTRKRVRQKRAKRKTPTADMTRAYKSSEAGLTLRAIAKELDKSPETIRQWVALAADWYGDNARSKRVRQGLLGNTADPKALPPDDALAS